MDDYIERVSYCTKCGTIHIGGAWTPYCYDCKCKWHETQVNMGVSREEYYEFTEPERDELDDYIEQEIFDAYIKDYGEFSEAARQNHLNNLERQRKESLNSIVVGGSSVKCPYCKSTNTKKISGSTKAVSIGFWGLLSNKIGKQWHCNNCGSNF
jgi:ribosomal protein L37AE/L43A|nr:MAG TPA: FdhE-like protein [Caudoviricetes sp.]